jgi:alpha-beta hydrolase superfamily lysophospholipase
MLLVLVILLVVCLPAAVALVCCGDDRLERIAGAWPRWRARRRERRTIARLDRAVEAHTLTRDIDLAEFDRPDRRPLDQIAADLWRLRAYRLGRGGRPTVWPLLLIQAYDDRLRLACRCLGVTEHLAELEGVDREIERIRVEGALHAAGLPLPAATADHRQRHR